MSQRRIAWAVAIAVVVVVGVVPVLLDRDSFPLSTYPMFASPRTSTETIDTVVLVDDRTGTITRLSPEQIAGTDEVIVAAATVSNAIARGTAEELCEEVAIRILAGLAQGANAIEVVTERYDAVAWFTGDKTPLSRTVHARCEFTITG